MESEMESALRQRRLGRAGRWPGVPTLVPLLLLAPVFSAPALIILQPVFTDAGVAADLLGGGSSARLQLSVVSSAFFAVWGPGTLVLSALSDFVGRKPVLLGCAAMTSILTLAGSLTPNFLVYATCRTLLGITCGAQGAVSFLHAVEWGLPKDNGLLTCVLMSSWSFFGMILASIAALVHSESHTTWRSVQLVLCLINAAVLPCVLLVLESPPSLMSRDMQEEAKRNLSVALTHRFPTALGRCYASMAMITPLSQRRTDAQKEEEHEQENAERGFTTLARNGVPAELTSPEQVGQAGSAMEEEAVTFNPTTRLAEAEHAHTNAVLYNEPAAPPADHNCRGEVVGAAASNATPISRGCGGAAGIALSHDSILSDGSYHGGGGILRVCVRWGPLLVTTGLCWLAVALLYYGLDFAVGDCEASRGCDKYSNLALYCLFDVPGYVLGFLLADWPAVGRKRALGLSLAFAGSCLLLTPPLRAVAPSAANQVTLALSLAGKLGASAGFVLAYMLPAEVFPTKMRGFAIGVANVFARMGSMIAPLCASAPPIVVQIGLGSMSIAICALAMAKLPDLRVALEP